MPSADPKSVKVRLTAGTGVEIEWKDRHFSRYPFPFLRDACPCALCDEERSKTGRQPGEPPHTKPGELPMFKPSAKPVSAEPVGTTALKFKWNNRPQPVIYSCHFLRDGCRRNQKVLRIARGGELFKKQINQIFAVFPRRERIRHQWTDVSFHAVHGLGGERAGTSQI